MFKLIIADDESLVLQHLSKILDWDAYNIEIVGLYYSGDQVLRHLKKSHVDILISDIKMPYADGIALAKHCYENTPDTSVILISAFRDFEYAQKAMKYGVLNYITKPYTKDIIKDAIATTLAKKHQNQSVNNFDSFIKYMEYQTVFSDIFCGNIKSEQEIDFSLKNLNLTDCGGEIINFNILNFDDYINTNWKYGEIRLFNAISTLAFTKKDGVCFSMVYAKSNSFIVIAMSDSKDTIEKYKSNLISSLKIILDLDCESTTTDSFKGLIELVGFSSKSTSQDSEFLQNINNYLKKNYTKDITLNDAAGVALLNKVYFCSLYKKETGENFTDTLKKMRLEKAKDLLVNSDIKVSMINELIGYKSKPYFYKLFKQVLGMTPIEYRQIYSNNPRKG